MIKCKECDCKYTGETARNAHTRSIEHMNDAESNNIDEQERSVLLRHMNERHNGKKVEFEMKIIKNYQHDPLGRQSAEWVWIKNVEMKNRINNKNEFHQPGDVEVFYEKNQNQKIKIMRSANEKKIEKIVPQEGQESSEIGVPKPSEPSILDFLKNMRNNQERPDKNENDDDDNILSTQDMISDTRARRKQKSSIFQCEKCEFKSGLEILFNNHKKTTLNEGSYPCTKCEYKTKTKQDLKKHMDELHSQNEYQCTQSDNKFTTKQHLKTHIESQYIKNVNNGKNILAKKSNKATYILKRIKCEKCDKKFNKMETFQTHLLKIHEKSNAGKTN